MYIQHSIEDFCKLINGKVFGTTIKTISHNIVYDSRVIVDGSKDVFIAFKTKHADGHQFISEAYQKGTRLFIVQQKLDSTDFDGATFLWVNDTLKALQTYAHWYRKQLKYPIIAITGSAGKTMVKEWLFELLSDQYKISRSPKSFNSQIGVALSILSFSKQADFGIVEVGISEPNEMEILEWIIAPNFGVFTNIGTSHFENFKTKEAQIEEKIKLFKRCSSTFIGPQIKLSLEQLKTINGFEVNFNEIQNEVKLLQFKDQVSIYNASLAIFIAKKLKVKSSLLLSKIPQIRALALRLETFEGINNSLIINDTYNLDIDALKHSLSYQASIAKQKKKVVIIGIEQDNTQQIEEVDQLLETYKGIAYYIVDPNTFLKVDVTDAIVLLKGTRKATMEKWVKRLRLRKHQTFVEVNLSAIKSNIQQFKQLCKPSTMLMSMVKASAYGTGENNIPLYLQRSGIDYFGVAYADEGVTLRKLGVTKPIMVMNASADGFDDCIKFQLEPAIYSLNQLEDFIKELIFQGISHFPIHLKVDTGMRRLGFELETLTQVCQSINAQPEVYIKGMYSHLADADNLRDKRFTNHQIQLFVRAIKEVQNWIQYPFIKHILNSEGIVQYNDAQFDMIRLGIGMYGISAHPNFKKTLLPVIAWYSSISQVKKIKKGESVGYNRAFIAEKPMQIAVIPVGYADGFRRSLSFGKGGVYIKDTFCPTLGKVCMDMIMVDVTNLNVKEGDLVEIIGKNQSILQFSQLMETIPYEVMTSISSRVHRVYVND